MSPTNAHLPYRTETWQTWNKTAFITLAVIMLLFLPAHGMAADESLSKTKEQADQFYKEGKEAAIKWKSLQENAKSFNSDAFPIPDIPQYQSDLLSAAQREHAKAIELISQATDIYNQLLTTDDGLSSEDKEEILYRMVEAPYLLQNHSGAIQKGETLLRQTGELTISLQAKLSYLLGDAAWEQAKEKENYTSVRQYYQNALEIDNFYPEDTGERSNLAAIRLANVLLLKDKQFKPAIDHLKNAVELYSRTGYSFLNHYYYAKALQEYGDTLVEQSKSAQSRAVFRQAAEQFNQAIEKRDQSQYVDTQNQRFLIECMFQRGFCAAKGGDRKAKTYLNEALEKYRDRPTAKPYLDKTKKMLQPTEMKDVHPSSESPTSIPSAMFHRIDGTIDTRGTKLSRIVEILKAESGLNIYLDENADIQVTFKFINPTIKELLDSVLPPNNLDYIILSNNTIRIGKASVVQSPKYTPKDPSKLPPALLKRIEGPMEARGAHLSEVLRLLQTESGLQFVLDQGVDPQVTFHLQNPTILEVLNTNLPPLGLDFTVVGNSIIRIGYP